MTKIRFYIGLLVALLVLGWALVIICPWQQHLPEPLIAAPSALAKVDTLQEVGDGRWVRSFRGADGTIYLQGRLQTRDGGRTVVPQVTVDVEEINMVPERAVLSRPGLFYAVSGRAELESPGIYRLHNARSTDNLQTLVSESLRLEVPAGPKREPREGEWYGLYIYRTILEMQDGSWLMTMYGNFADDNLTPPDRSSQMEVGTQMRSFVVRSIDQGHSWQYLATIAAPRLGDPVGEGFVEPALTRLADGRLLCIMRTGHYFPLYASWSSDNGRTWTAPVYTGLDRGCDPCLITLADGRLALSWGRRFPENWSQLDEKGDVERFVWPGVTILNLALSNDGGANWVNHRIAKGVGSGYSTIFEVEPDVLLFQVDQWLGRITLRPHEELGG